MLTKEKTLTLEQTKITEGFEKLAKEYGEKFIAERTGFYMLEFLMVAETTHDEICKTSCGIRFLRTCLLSFFNRPETLHDFNLYLNEDEWSENLPCLFGSIRTLLNAFIEEVSDDMESDTMITRKDIDFLLDVRSIL